MRFTTALAATAALVGAAAAVKVEPIEMRDRHFFYKTSGEPFFIKGVDYQPGGSAKFKAGADPLSNWDTCSRDIYLFKELGINTIRVYSIDPDLDHDQCMTLLAQAGIYLVLDVNSPLEGQHLNNQQPWTTYTPDYLEHIFKVIDVFSGYANTLAFLAGNEVIFDKKSADASPNYVKAVVRDMKAYVTKHVGRVIPVGYSNADDLDFRTSLAAYLECGEIGYIDFFGVNSYQWCGDNTFEGSGYDKLVEDYTDYSLPVFFTEFGCNESPPRRWQEVGALYSDKMTNVFSGGLVYEFSQESNNYGLVDIKNGNVKTRDDYKRLVAAYKKVTGTKIPSGATKPKRPATCPDEGDDVFENIKANHTLPTTLGQEFIDDGVKVTRGKFITLDSMQTKYDITMDGSKVADKKVKADFETQGVALASGGHDTNTGGGVGKGAPASGSESDSGDDDGESAAVNIAPRGVVFISTLALVAIGFGVL